MTAEQFVSKRLFTSGEWQDLQFAPLWVFSTVAGIDEKIDEQELQALVKELQEAPLYKIPLIRDIFTSVWLDFDSIMKQYGNDSRDVLDGLGSVADILAKKVSSEEAESFKNALVFLGVSIAQASGGFLGFGNKVSDEEAGAISVVAETLKVDLSSFTQSVSIQDNSQLGGFQEMFNLFGKAAGKAACLVSLHQWSEWTYKSSENCLQEHTCERCQKQDSRLEHTWGNWSYTSPTSCSQKRTCLRCSQRENRTEHTQLIWEYKLPDSCNQVQVCQRCNSRRAERENHTWGQWEYKSLNSCEQVQVCQRCAKSENRISHSWNVWQYESPTSCTQVRFCLRCHERETGQKAHKWNEWQDNTNTGQRERVCTHCGDKEYLSS